jgi:hypothetical protein
MGALHCAIHGSLRIPLDCLLHLGDHEIGLAILEWERLVDGEHEHEHLHGVAAILADFIEATRLERELDLCALTRHLDEALGVKVAVLPRDWGYAVGLSALGLGGAGHVAEDLGGVGDLVDFALGWSLFGHGSKCDLIG